MTRVTVRHARREDAPTVARLFMMAWPMDSFLAMSPELTEESFAEMVREYVAADGTLYSYANTFVAEADGVVAGAICGYDGARCRELKRPILEDFARRFPDANNSFGDYDETEAGEFYLDSIGVDPSMRSLGIGSKLFEAMLGYAAENGFSRAGLLVDVDNPKAEALYFRLGFRQCGFKDFFGHQMKHLQIELS